jgi:rhodanese-related sulfurtransferase
VVSPSRIDLLLDETRLGLHRVNPAEAADVMARGGLLVDTRPSELRHRDGEIPGALVVDRNVLEWRLDPSSPYRHPTVAEHDHDRAVVVVCDEGYASSLAAASLRSLGLRHATDLIGGFQAWRSAGQPVTPPAVPVSAVPVSAVPVSGVAASAVAPTSEAPTSVTESDANITTS